MKISVVEYMPEWRDLFELEMRALEGVLPAGSAVIEHMGSTSVPGLAAKPIIDIMIGVRDFSTVDALIEPIVSLGYEYVPQFEDVMPYRRYFRKEMEGRRTHHIHMVARGGEFWERHLLFRDFLRGNPDVADEYAALKRELALRDWRDGNEYADAKTEFITSIEMRARELTSST